jgi:hypothetical protein
MKSFKLYLLIILFFISYELQKDRISKKKQTIKTFNTNHLVDADEARTGELVYFENSIPKNKYLPSQNQLDFNDRFTSIQPTQHISTIETNESPNNQFVVRHINSLYNDENIIHSYYDNIKEKNNLSKINLYEKLLSEKDVLLIKIAFKWY